MFCIFNLDNHKYTKHFAKSVHYIEQKLITENNAFSKHYDFNFIIIETPTPRKRLLYKHLHIKLFLLISDETRHEDRLLFCCYIFLLINR